MNRKQPHPGFELGTLFPLALGKARLHKKIQKKCPSLVDYDALKRMVEDKLLYTRVELVYFTPCKFFPLALTGGISLESEWQQVS